MQPDSAFMPIEQSAKIEPKRVKGVRTLFGKFTSLVLTNVGEVMEQIGVALMGDLWQMVYLTIQDAIALSILQKVPEVIFSQITGKSFTELNACMDENWLGAAFYACFVIVSSDISVWIVLSVRTSRRFFAALVKRETASQEES